MKELKYNGLSIFTDVDDLSEEELVKYIDNVIKHNGGTQRDIIKIVIKDQKDGTVDVSYDTLSTVKFERLRRITGYLSETSNWNDGKRAELAERVKHA